MSDLQTRLAEAIEDGIVEHKNVYMGCDHMGCDLDQSVLAHVIKMLREFCGGGLLDTESMRPVTARQVGVRQRMLYADDKQVEYEDVPVFVLEP